jgi:hypothetical protein
MDTIPLRLGMTGIKIELLNLNHKLGIREVSFGGIVMNFWNDIHRIG